MLKGYTNHEIARRGEEIYESRLRSELEPHARGKYLVLDIETGEYELDSDAVAAIQRAVSRRPDGVRYIKRIGVPIRLGGSAAAHTP